ncbi:exocyst complex component 3-like isoform X2 [Halichondria panicea]|uniref:exocyst complex component 3-like isoform X2 n=1 Tax=Halichondria panicea TaxID=6063 RepID=UPI00312B35C5
MEFSSAEADAKDLAKKEVVAHLTKPDQLDRLEQYKRKISRKKATIESQLRNAVQTQLDGVQKGLKSLQEASGVMQTIRLNMGEVEQLYQQCADLSEVVKPIKDVSRKHQQLKTTMVHIQNIFNVPQVCQETKELIADGRLLEAHRNLAELEHTRDELLIQLFHSEDSYVDKNTSLHHYFEPLAGLSSSLGQQLWLIMHQTTGLVEGEPRKLVTALRIIEREEKTDALIKDMLDEKSIPHSQLPGRPKKWKEKCLEILETSISNKFEELEPGEQEKMENKAWLVEYLTSVATFCYTDLQAIKDHGTKCFPPQYDILDKFIKWYHQCLVKLISERVQKGLNAKDIITIMIWIGDVRESFNETLDIDFNNYGQLIDPAIEKDLQTTCQEQVEGNVKELVGKMVETEREDWDSTTPPDADVDGAYYTTVGITLFQMIDQNISALSPLGISNKLRVLAICLDAVLDFIMFYGSMVEDYFKCRLQTQRRMPPFFINYMIATANNCRSCVEFAEQLRKRFCLELNETVLDAEYERLFKKVSEEFDAVGHQCATVILDDAFMDLEPLLQGLLTKDAWFGNPGDLVGKTEGTILDYNEDFNCLKPAYYSYVIVESQHRVMNSYMQAMMQKRMVFKKDKDRERAAKMIKDEVKRINNVFQRLSHATNPKYAQGLEMMAELITSKTDFLAMDISALATKHPDVRPSHVIAILAMRGDLNKSLVAKWNSFEHLQGVIQDVEVEGRN